MFKRTLLALSLLATPAAAHDIYNGLHDGFDETGQQTFKRDVGRLCCGGDPETGDCEAMVEAVAGIAFFGFPMVLALSVFMECVCSDQDSALVDAAGFPFGRVHIRRAEPRPKTAFQSQY